MRTASTGQPGTERSEHPAILGTLDVVPWHEIQDSTGSAAAIPGLLDDIARGSADTATAALGELRKRICQYGFVVEQATAATVPFLWELAQSPHVTCRPQIIRLLASIAEARQWEHTASAYPKLLNHRENPVAWERAARQAVHARRGTLRSLLDEQDAELVRATGELARTLGV
ncbi:hypothetical protein ABT382_27965 [Streptomyces pharetrae]|uniref:AbaA n=1 Tax=Streptomyces pharetrae CZA14 TaxID=1144883 RepID=A0ABX3YG12_9ACTN|nr:hypothetical protein OQI_21860 [Streptomyces pharetrae CZA14]